MKPRPTRMGSTSWRNSSLSNWRHCTFPHSAQCSTSSPRNMPIARMSSFSSRCRSRVRWIRCAGVPRHKKSELRAYQMARICGVPASLSKKIRPELSSNVSSRPAESSSNGSCWVSLAQNMRKFRDFSLRDGDSLDSLLLQAFPLFLDSQNFTLLSPPRSPCPGQPLRFSLASPLLTYEAFPRPVDSLPPTRLWYGSASPASLRTSSLLQASTRGGYVFQGVRTCFRGATEYQFDLSVSKARTATLH